MKKICLIASGGGHLEQLRLITLNESYNYFYVTMKSNASFKKRVYYLINTKNRGISFPFKMILIFIKSLVILIKEKPNIVISTGAGETYPFVFLAKKIFKMKVIYIESFSAFDNLTKTGKKIISLADVFVVQSEKLKSINPKFEYWGTIY